MQFAHATPTFERLLVLLASGMSRRLLVTPFAAGGHFRGHSTPVAPVDAIFVAVTGQPRVLPADSIPAFGDGTSTSLRESQ